MRWRTSTYSAPSTSMCAVMCAPVGIVRSIHLARSSACTRITLRPAHFFTGGPGCSSDSPNSSAAYRP
eukprot:3750271-Prymnesium_polylepis.1